MTSKPETTRETAWLIERRSAGLSPQWMAAGQRPGDHAWTWSANEAIKFAGREKAEAACCGGHIDDPLLVTEHAFIDMRGRPSMRPCPFCGGEGRVIPDPGNKHRSNVLYRPQCDRCGGGLGGFDTSDFAVAAWNRRSGTTSTIEMPLSDVNELDAVVHELGIEDSDTTPAEAVGALKAELEEATLARGRLRLWLEFIHHNCTSPEAREYAGEAMNGAHVPEGFDWDERSGRYE